MGSGLFFQVSALAYSLILIIVYFLKPRIKSLETKIYGFLIITNFFGLILDILCVVLAKSNVSLLVVDACGRMYLVYLLVWITLMTLYICAINSSFENKVYKITKRIILSIMAIFVIMALTLPYQSIIENNIIYSAGLAVTLSYVYSILQIFIWVIILLANYKKMKKAKLIPLFSFMLLGIVVIGIQSNKPELLLMTAFESLITFLMYFTIENPDLKMINELNIARNQADKANQAKSDFLSSMSHEIRTPLNAIVGFSESLKEEDLPESAKDEVDDIISASESLLEIVNGILDISKIEANKLEIVNNEYDIHKMFKDLVSLTKVRIGEKPIELKVNIDQSIPQVLYGDHTRVKQIILNLLTNAAKYTDKGFIEFNVQSVIKDETCRLIISVKDTGKGIKQENIDKLFTKFERFDEKNSTIEGTGLGLAITKKLINLMGGSIVVNSVYQKGSNFMVSLDQAIVKNPTIIKEEPTKQVEQASYQDKKILIVDDNELNLKVAKRLLQTYEMQIDTVLSGDEALSKIRNNEIYDLILLDDMMPHKSGSETLTELRQIENFNIPVVVLTANAIEGMKEKYLEMGFDDYLAKPISKEELKRILLKYLN